MTNQIDREKLIETLSFIREQYQNEANKNPIDINDFLDRFKANELIKMVNQLTWHLNKGHFDAPEATGWISVKEQGFPKKEGEYWVYPGMGYSYRAVDQVYYDPDRYHGQFDKELDICITHWMEVPQKPPAPEKDDAR